MIIQETIQNEIHTYSDANFCIRKVGTDEIYDEAYDPIQFADSRKYEETDIKIEVGE